MQKNKYSFSEISNILNTSVEDVKSVLASSDLLRNKHFLLSEEYLEEEFVDIFFRDYIKSRNILPKHFDIPDHLIKNGEGWALTLVNMYRELFSYGSITPSQGEIIRNLVLNIRPNVIVEIGCCIGVSSIWMASALEEIGKESSIHSIDLFDPIFPSPPHRWGYLQNPQKYAQNSAALAKLEDRISFHKINSNKMGKEYAKHIRQKADLLYIDGDHRIGGCITDFVLFYPHVKVGGYIILHDIYPQYCGWEGPRYLIDKFLKRSESFEIEEISTVPNYGFAVIKKLQHDKRFDPGGSLALEIHRLSYLFVRVIVDLFNWKRIRYTRLGKMLRKLLTFWPFV